MLRAVIFTALFLIGTACSLESPEPPARTVGTNTPAEPDNPDDPADPGDTGEPDAALGLTAYDAKCAECHGAAADSQKKGRDGPTILAAADNPAHSGVAEWPDATESANIAAAIPAD
ncbi:MAG: c-type cytochrome [Pseudobacteriovorax sp.]|nr:c-type cytochrome [Pseudobacteriovorax sp.]